MSFETDLSDALRRGYVAAVRLLGDREAAKDACQEAASRSLSARSSYDPEREFYPWFHKILRNHCLDLLGRRGRMVFRGSIDGPSPMTLEQQYIESDEERRVVVAIDRLEPDLREIIELRHFQDLSYREIAQVLDCPEGTVMSRLYRARKALREILTASRDQTGSCSSCPGSRG